MTSFWYRITAVAGVLVLVSADRPPSPEEWIRQGNAAFEFGDFRSAVSLYDQASEYTDPGLVAFNRATVLYHQEQFREAEQLYRRCLDDRDIPTDRLARALYNLGNCLVRQGDDDLDRLRSAISCYRRARDAQPSDMALRDDIEHNLQLAKMRWAQAAAQVSRPPLPDHEPADTTSLPDPARPQGNEQQGFTQAGDQAGNPQPSGIDPLESPAGADQAQPTDQQTPGAGNLPVLPDSEELEPLTPEQAQEHLINAAIRLHRERRSLSTGNSGTDRPDVRNW